MKFTVNREKLQKALQRVGSIIGSRSMFPVLGNVLMQAEDNVLTLTTTDLEIRISTKIEAAVEVPGVSTAPARKLASLVGCFVGADVMFDIDDKDHIKLKCGTSHFTLLGLAAADFPAAEQFEAKREIRVKEGEFKKMVASIAYAVSADDSRKVLTGVLLSARESTITLVATEAAGHAGENAGIDHWRRRRCDHSAESGAGDAPPAGRRRSDDHPDRRQAVQFRRQ